MRDLNSQNAVKDKRRKKEILTQPIQYQASVVIWNFKTGLDLYSRCGRPWLRKNQPEVFDLPLFVKCSSQILRAAFALNKKFTLKTVLPLISTFTLFRVLSNFTAYNTQRRHCKNQAEETECKEIKPWRRFLFNPYTFAGLFSTTMSSLKARSFYCVVKLLFIVTLFC